MKDKMKDKVKIKAKARAKAKIQRGVAAIPMIGLASLAVFEKMEFDDWKKDHPDGTPEEYARQLSETTQELFNEEYRDFQKYADQIVKYTDQMSATSQELINKNIESLKNIIKQ